jgi:hypothetical protein
VIKTAFFAALGGLFLCELCVNGFCISLIRFEKFYEKISDGKNYSNPFPIHLSLFL